MVDWFDWFNGNCEWTHELAIFTSWDWCWGKGPDAPATTSRPHSESGGAPVLFSSSTIKAWCTTWMAWLGLTWIGYIWLRCVACLLPDPTERVRLRGDGRTSQTRLVGCTYALVLLQVQGGGDSGERTLQKLSTSVARLVSTVEFLASPKSPRVGAAHVSHFLLCAVLPAYRRGQRLLPHCHQSSAARRRSANQQTRPRSFQTDLCLTSDWNFEGKAPFLANSRGHRDTGTCRHVADCRHLPTLADKAYQSPSARTNANSCSSALVSITTTW